MFSKRGHKKKRRVGQWHYFPLVCDQSGLVGIHGWLQPWRQDVQRSRWPQGSRSRMVVVAWRGVARGLGCARSRSGNGWAVAWSGVACLGRSGGVPWPGHVWPDLAWRVVAWWGGAWRGLARRGLAWRGWVWRGVVSRGAGWSGCLGVVRRQRGVTWCGVRVEAWRAQAWCGRAWGGLACGWRGVLWQWVTARHGFVRSFQLRVC